MGSRVIEYEVIENLIYVAVLSRTVASSIVSMDWFQDGVDGVEAEALGWVNNIGSAEVATAVVSLRWVVDGIDEIEVKAIELLSYVDYADAKVASSVVSLSWVADDIEEIEAKAIEELSFLANGDADVASSVVSLDWVQDGVHGLEVETIGWVNNIGGAEVASAVVSLGWVVDGIDEFEVKALEEISYIDYRDTEVAFSVVSMDWVRDGIDGIEAEALDWINNMKSAEVASSVVSLGWVADGLNEVEVKAIVELSYLANGDAEEAQRIVGMPFLETIEPPDISAVMSLSRLATFAPEAFVVVMSHAALRGGITNDLAPAVATLYGVAQNNPGLIDVLLDRSKVSLEQRTITLPLAGDIVLSIIRTGPGAATSMDLLEHSVRGVEEFMGCHCRPTMLACSTKTPSTVPTQEQILVLTSPYFPNSTPTTAVWSRQGSNGSTIAHEVAHY